MGAHIVDRVAAHVEELSRAAHRACVAAAEHVARRAAGEHYVGHALRHVVAVVAAEDGAHEEAVLTAGIDDVGVVEQHAHRVLHTHAVAAAKHGVDEAATGVDVDEGRALARTVVAPVDHAHWLHVRVFRALGVVVVVGSVAAAVDAVDGRGAVNQHVGREGPVARAVGQQVVERGVVAGHIVGRVHARTAVGSEGIDDAQAVVGREERALDPGVARDVRVAEAVEVRQVAAAVGVAVVVGGGGHVGAHRAASHGEVYAAHLVAHGDGLVGLPVAQVYLLGRALQEADVGHHAAAIGRVQHIAALDVEVRVVLRRHEQPHIFAVEVLVGTAHVVAQRVGRAVVEVGARGLVVAVVVAVAAAVDALQHQRAVEHRVGALVSGRAHVAADVVAAVHIAEGASLEPQHRRVPHVGHAAAGVDLLHHDARVGRRVHQRAQSLGFLKLPALQALVGHQVGQRAVVGQRHLVVHVASVAAAIDVADAARHQVDGAQGGHRGAVVAAEEGANVVAAYGARHPSGTVVFQGRVVGLVRELLLAAQHPVDHVVGHAVVVEDVVRAAAVDNADRVLHRGHVAAQVATVYHAACHVDLGARAVHQVAAAEEVAYAILAAILAEEAVLYVLLAGGRQLGVVHVDLHAAAVGERAAVVVAAKEGVHRAAIHVDGRRAAVGHADEGILGTAEEGVDEHVVVVLRVVVAVALAVGANAHGDARAPDVGHRAVAAVAPLGVARGAGQVIEGGGRHPAARAPVEAGGVVGPHARGRRALFPHRARAPLVDAAAEPVVGVGQAVGVAVGVVGVVVGVDDHAGIDVEAAAAAIDAAYAHLVGVVGEGAAQLHRGAGLALHPSCYVVAAIDGANAVGIVHRDGRAARHIGHAASAEHRARHHRGAVGFGHLAAAVLVGECQLHRVAQRDAFLKVGIHPHLHHHALRRHILAAQHGALGAALALDGHLHIAVALVVELVAQGTELELVRLGHRRHVDKRLLAVAVVHLRLPHAAVAVTGAGAQPVVGVDAVAEGLLLVPGVGRHDLHRAAVGHRGGHRGSVLVAQGVGPVVVAHRERRYALAFGQALHRAGIRCHLDRQVERRPARRLLHIGVRGVAKLIVLVRGQAGVGLRGRERGVAELARVGTLVGVARHAPGAVGKDGPVVGLVAHTVAVGHVGDGRAEVPVVELRGVLKRGAHSDDIDPQPLRRALQVVAVARVLLVVEAGVAGAHPHAVLVQAKAEVAAGNHGLRGVLAVNAQRQVVLAVLGHQVVAGAQGVQLAPRGAVEVYGVVGREERTGSPVCLVPLGSLVPQVLAVGQREVARRLRGGTVGKQSQQQYGRQRQPGSVA